MEEEKTKFLDQAINDEILEKLSLKNRYAFLNTNLMTIIDKKEMNFIQNRFLNKQRIPLRMSHCISPCQWELRIILRGWPVRVPMDNALRGLPVLLPSVISTFVKILNL